MAPPPADMTPPPGPFNVVEGIYHDARSPSDMAVLVRVEMDDLVIADQDGVTLVRWPLDELITTGGSVEAGELRLRRGRSDLDRLIIRDRAFIEQLVEMLPQLVEERVFDLGRLRLVFGLMLIMGGAVGVLFFLLVPIFGQSLARAVPNSWEALIGDRVQVAIVENYARQAGKRPDELICKGEVGQKALDKLLARIEPHARTDFPLKVTVLDLDVMNAFALPGGHILLFRGLLRFANSGDEVAGVIAHEASHVRYHHPSQKIFENGATTLLLNMLFGDFGGRSLALNLGELLLNARYSRGMEYDADEDAIRILQAADINPVALADFLDRIQRGAGPNEQAFSWLMSHPVSRLRAERVRRLPPQEGTSPALSDAEFLRLRLICANDQRRPEQRLPLKNRGNVNPG